MAKDKIRYKYVYKDTNRTFKFSPEVVSKLEEAASVDASIAQTCYYAGISRDTYYRWMEENPKLSDRLDDLRQRRPLKANQNITAAIESGDIGLSKWELEKKQPEQYGEKLKIEHSGAIGADVDSSDEVKSIRQKHRDALKADLKAIIHKRAKEEKANKQIW